MYISFFYIDTHAWCITCYSSQALFLNMLLTLDSIMSFFGKGKPGRSQYKYIFFLFYFLVVTILQTNCLEKNLPFMLHKHPIIINNFITVLEQTIKNQHFRFFHLFSLVYKPRDMTRTEIKKRKCSGIQMHFPMFFSFPGH